MPIAEPFSSIKQATSSLPQCCGADTGLHPITTSKLKPLRFLCSPVQESPGGVNGNGHMALKSTALGGGGEWGWPLAMLTQTCLHTQNSSVISYVQRLTLTTPPEGGRTLFLLVSGGSEV